MRNSAGLYNDGLTSSCANNGQVRFPADFFENLIANTAFVDDMDVQPGPQPSL